MHRSTRIKLDTEIIPAIRLDLKQARIAKKSCGKYSTGRAILSGVDLDKYIHGLVNQLINKKVDYPLPDKDFKIHNAMISAKSWRTIGDNIGDRLRNGFVEFQSDYKRGSRSVYFRRWLKRFDPVFLEQIDFDFLYSSKEKHFINKAKSKWLYRLKNDYQLSSGFNLGKGSIVRWDSHAYYVRLPHDEAMNLHGITDKDVKKYRLINSDCY